MGRPMRPIPTKPAIDSVFTKVSSRSRFRLSLEKYCTLHFRFTGTQSKALGSGVIGTISRPSTPR